MYPFLNTRIKKYLKNGLFGLLLLVSSGLSAQVIRIPVFNAYRRSDKAYEDSLKRVGSRLEAELADRPDNAYNDSLRIRLFNVLGEVYIDSDRNNLDTVFMYSEKLYTLSKKYNDKQMMLRALFRKELKYRRLHQYSESLKLCFEAMELCEQLGENCKRIGEIEQILGNTFLFAKDYENAEKYLLRALKSIDLYPYRTRERLMVDKGYLTGTLARVYTRWNKMEKAEKEFLVQLSLMKASGLEVAIANADEETGDFYNRAGDPEKAFPYYDEALAIYTRKKSQEGIASIYNSKAEAYLNMKNYEKALEFANLAMDIARKEKLTLLMPFTYDVIYKANLAVGKELEALRASQRAYMLKDSNDLKKRLLEMNDVRKLYEFEQAKIRNERLRITEEFRLSTLQKQFEVSKLKAEKLAQDFRLTEISRKLESEKALSKENYLKLVAEKHQSEEERLNKQLKLEELNNKLTFDALQRKALLGVLALISLLGGLAIVYSVILKRKNLQLKAKNAEVQEALLKGQTIERKRVATELHDNLGSLLSAVRVSLLTLDSDKLPNHDQNVYLQIKQMVDDACKEVRLISHNMLPEELEKFGLDEAIQKMVDRLNFSTPIEFTLNNKGLKDIHLEKKVAFHIYSICLELINNILKHSEATDATITFRTDGQSLDLFVRDNGKGISEADTGRGLEGISDRVNFMEGHLKVQSNEEEGTKVHVNVPLNLPVYSASQT